MGRDNYIGMPNIYLQTCLRRGKIPNFITKNIKKLSFKVITNYFLEYKLLFKIFSNSREKILMLYYISSVLS